MSKGNKFIPNENQVSLNDTLNGHQREVKIFDKDSNETYEEIIISSEMNDKEKNKEKNDNIDYGKQINDLNKKVDNLTNIISSFQEFIMKYSPVIDEIALVDGEKEERYKFDSKTGKRIIHNNEILEEEKRSNYVFNVNNKNVDSRPDMIINTKDDEGKDHTIIVETKMKRDNNSNINGKLTVRQKELPFWDKTGSVLGGAIGGLFAGVGGLALGMKVGKEMFDSKNKDEIKDINGIDRDFLLANPIENYHEFIEILNRIYPQSLDETMSDMLEQMYYGINDPNIYNTALLKVFDREIKILNNKPKLQLSVPYLNIDFEDYKLTNNLRQIMKDRNISQEQMADLIGVSRSSLINLLNNKGTTLENAWKISISLGIPIQEIFKFDIPEEIEE